jgi:hypothetical protein
VSAIAPSFEARPGWLDRASDTLLSLAAPATAGDEPAEARSFASLRRFVLAAIAVEAVNALRFDAYQDRDLAQRGLAVLLAIAFALGWSGRAARAAAWLAFAALAASVAIAFPENANHQFAELWLLSLFGLANHADPLQRRRLLQSARWLFAIGFFWAGLQKCLWGYYFRGEFLAQRIAIDPAFREVFAWLAPSAEIARLAALGDAEGSGPFRIDSLFFVVLSNGVWLGELAVAAALFVPRLRRLTVLAALLFLAAIELGARELFFGFLMANLALLWLGPRIHARALPGFLVVYAYLLGMALGWMPHWSFG